MSRQTRKRKKNPERKIQVSKLLPHSSTANTPSNGHSMLKCPFGFSQSLPVSSTCCPSSTHRTYVKGYLCHSFSRQRGQVCQVWLVQQKVMAHTMLASFLTWIMAQHSRTTVARALHIPTELIWLMHDLGIGATF